MAQGSNPATTRNRPIGPHFDRVDRVLEEKRGIHPEARVPLGWNGLLAILRRERISVVYAPLLRPAALLTNRGISVLLLNSDLPPRRHTYYGAHELGHAWLHADTETEACFHMDVVWPDDPREDEAEYCAACLLGGPQSY